MATWWKHSLRHDLAFLILVFASLVCVAGFLTAQFETGQQPAGGWRRVDLSAVNDRIEAGDLQRHEADWYHPADPVIKGGKP
jgi:hypothetical protein